MLDKGKTWRDVSFKPISRAYGIIFLGGSLLSILESFYFEDFWFLTINKLFVFKIFLYSDINSYHYNENMDKSLLVQALKSLFFISYS